MATEVKMPDLGEGVEDASISRWLVKEGDTVSAGDVILEVATDKVDTEVPAPAAGKILKLAVGEGEIVGLDAVLALIGEDGEDVAEASTAAAEEKAAPATPATAEEPAAVAEPPADAAESSATDGVRATPVAKRVAAEKGLSLDNISGTGPGGQITKDDVLASTTSAQESVGTEEEALPGELANIAPLEVRRLAADYNIDLTEVADGRALSTLTRYDLLNAVCGPFR
ncbi:MAG: biotin/lipoyl-containing protein [Caldilineaceae bacterium]